MTSQNPETDEWKRRLDEAADWQLQLKEDPAIEFLPEFLAWREVPENREALGTIEAAWDLVGTYGTAPEFLDMRRGALTRMRSLGKERWAPRYRWATGLAAAVLLVAMTWTGLLYFSDAQGYETGIGERRAVALSDGSMVSLDANTVIKVSYSPNARHIELQRGRAHFDVAHDTSRPFTVTAGRESVVAVGTSFDVEKVGNSVFVTLIQGRVIVKGAPAIMARPVIKRPIALRAGQQLVAEAANMPVVQDANLQTADAWQAGHLIFKDEELGEAIERVNRYAPRPVTVDPGIAGLKVSGVFNAGDVSAFVSAMTGFYPVEAVTDDDNRIHLEKR